MLPKLLNRFRSTPAEKNEIPSDAPADLKADDKHVAIGAHDNVDVSETADDEIPSENVQEGVKRAEAITIAWNKKALATVLISIWFLYCANAFQSSITGNLTPFVLSGFEAHSLIPTIYIVSSVMAGSVRLAVSRMLDLWGRPQGFVVMVAIATLGLILMAATSNVETFAAAQVFYTVGFDGVIYAADVVTADASTLRNRGLAYAFTSSPYIITAFAGPKAAEGFYEKISWRWAFGAFCIIIPAVAAPLFGTLIYHQKKAKAAGLLVERNSGRIISQSIKHYLVEFDVLGIFFFAAGFVLFLLPFSLAESAPHGWGTGYIIAMLVLGICLLIAFVLVERFVVPIPFLPWDVLMSRTVLGSCLLGASYQVAYYCYGSYFSSYLQVVHNLSISTAGYVMGVWDVVSGLWIIVVGYLIHRTGRFKWLLMAAVPFDILGIGLMIYFRQPKWSVGYVIMCQVFIAISGGTIILTQQVSIMSAVNHDKVAAVLALLGLFGYMGGAIGNTISGAVWTHTVPGALDKFLPDYAKENATDIYNSLDVQLSYPIGDEVRTAIIEAYAIGQRNMCTAGVVVMVLSLVWVVIIKDKNVKHDKQVKGVVF